MSGFEYLCTPSNACMIIADKRFINWLLLPSGQDPCLLYQPLYKLAAKINEYVFRFRKRGFWGSGVQTVVSDGEIRMTTTTVHRKFNIDIFVNKSKEKPGFNNPQQFVKALLHCVEIPKCSAARFHKVSMRPRDRF